MKDKKEGVLWALYIFPGIIFGALFVVSISKLLGVGILPPSMHSGFLYEAGKIFKQKPLVIPVLFIIFFGAYLLQGFFTFSERNRNQAFAGAALGGVSISLVILIHTFWELILSHPPLFLGPFIVVGSLVANYFASPWRKWLIKRVHKKLKVVEEIVNDFLEMMRDIKVEDLPRTFNEIMKYKDKISNIRKKIDADNANLNLEDLNSADLLEKVKLLESVDTGESVIYRDEENIRKEISEYIAVFENEEIIDRVLQYYLSEENFKYWENIKEEIVGERL